MNRRICYILLHHCILLGHHPEKNSRESGQERPSHHLTLLQAKTDKMIIYLYDLREWIPSLSRKNGDILSLLRKRIKGNLIDRRRSTQ